MLHLAKSRRSHLIASLFIFLFVYTATSKFLQFALFRVTLSKSPLIGNGSEVFAWIIPFIELLVAGLLFHKSTRRIGFYTAFILMALFTAYVLYMILFIPELPCSCGGVLKSMSWEQHLIFNLFFTGLAFYEILKRKKPAYNRNPNDSFQLT